MKVMRTLHMDVTILDAARQSRQERVGEIFHSPDHEKGYRVPSNPYGLSVWYRSQITQPSQDYPEVATNATRPVLLRSLRGQRNHRRPRLKRREVSSVSASFNLA
jgi:hypothetical protein